MQTEGIDHLSITKDPNEPGTSCLVVQCCNHLRHLSPRIGSSTIILFFGGGGLLSRLVPAQCSASFAYFVASRGVLTVDGGS